MGNQNFDIVKYIDKVKGIDCWMVFCYFDVCLRFGDWGFGVWYVGVRESRGEGEGGLEFTFGFKWSLTNGFCNWVSLSGLFAL